MTPVLQSPPQINQTDACLRGLLTIAWADGHFDPDEQAMICGLTHYESSDPDSLTQLQPISPTDLALVLGSDPRAAENFMRMGVLVALADGAYSFCEDETLYQFCQALHLDTHVLEALRSTLIGGAQEQSASALEPSSHLQAATIEAHRAALLKPVREWMDQLEIHDPRLARFLCKAIPPQCPFERDINLFGRRVAHIPPLCKLNPLYEQLIGLRFRALSYLADDCGEDVSPYC